MLVCYFFSVGSVQKRQPQPARIRKIQILCPGSFESIPAESSRYRTYLFPIRLQYLNPLAEMNANSAIRYNGSSSCLEKGTTDSQPPRNNKNLAGCFVSIFFSFSVFTVSHPHSDPNWPSRQAPPWATVARFRLPASSVILDRKMNRE